jgi:hypothetical protein
LRAPALNPTMKYRCNITYRKITGAMAIKEAAKTNPHWVR